MAKKFHISTVFKGIDKMSAPLSKMRNKLRKFGVAASRTFKKMGAAAKKIGKGMLKFGAIGAGAILGVTTAVLSYVTATNAATMETTALAQALGLSADKAEAFESILKPVGMGAENVADLIEEMSNKFGESKGLEELAPVSESLKILGLRFNDIKKLSPEKQFETITNAALRMKDAQQAASAVDILMGGEANKIVTVLRQRGGTLDDIISKQNELNIFTDRGRAGAGAYTKAFSNMSLVFGSLNKELAGLLGEHLAPLIERFNEWARVNRELIRSKLVEFIDKLKQGVAFVRDNWEAIKKWGTYIAIATVAIGALVVGVIAISAAVAGVVAAIPALIIALKVALVGAAIWATAKIFEAFDALGGLAIAVFDRVVMSIKMLWVEAIDFITRDMEKLWDKTKEIAEAFGLGGVMKFVGIDPSKSRRAEPQAGAPVVTTPGERTARLLESRITNSAEVTIRDETGRAKVTQGGDFKGFNFAGSGAM